MPTEGSLAQDLIWSLRFRRRRRRSVEFRRPCWPAFTRWSYDPRFERHTDGIDWLTRSGEEFWLVGERLWHGWPDPPQWAFWALDAEQRLIAAADFDLWPPAWIRRDDGSRCELGWRAAARTREDDG